MIYKRSIHDNIADERQKLSNSKLNDGFPSSKCKQKKKL